MFMFDDRTRLRGDAVPTVFVDVIPPVFVECFVLSAPASPLTSTCDTDTAAASSLTSAFQQNGDDMKVGIVTDVASSSTPHSRTAQIDDVVTIGADEDGDKGSQNQSSMQNKDHTYYRRSVRVTKKKKTVDNADHNYFSLVPSLETRSVYHNLL